MTLNTAQVAALEARRTQSWNLRVSGKTLREIAAELEISLGTAFNDIEAVLERTKAEANEQALHHRAIQLARLDKASSVLMPMLDDPETALAAMDRLDKLERRRAELLGLDAPKQTEIDVTARAGPTAADAARLVREKFGQHASKAAEDEADGAT